MSAITAPAGRRPGRSRQADLRRAAEHGLCGVLPVVATLALVAYQFKLHAVALDFHVAYYPAVERLLHGLSPYAVTSRQIADGTGFIYPALSAVLLAPFGLVNRGTAEVVYMLLCVGCVPAILRTLEVRDWRVYGVAMLWFPVFNGWESGNVTLPLTLMIALAWRHRHRPLVTGLVTALAISIKPFIWPLGLWLLATRRWRAFAWAVAWGLAFNLVAWWLVGFNEFSTFLHLSSEDAGALWKQGYGVLAVAHHLGWSHSTGEVLVLLVSVATAAVLVHRGAVKRRERDALALTVLLMLLASPLLWAHYFALLLVPLALYRPRLGAAWVLPVLMWPIPPRQPVHGWEEALAWGLVAACLAVTLMPRAAQPGRRR